MKIEQIKQFVKIKLDPIKRKFGDPTSQYDHCFRVARTITELTSDPELSCVALCHDLIEDSDTTVQDLQELGLSKEHIDIVMELTNDDELFSEIGRVNAMCQKLNNISYPALLIKLADRYDNIKSALKCQSENPSKQVNAFVSKYLAETEVVIYRVLNDRMEVIEQELGQMDEPEKDYVLNGCIVLWNEILLVLAEAKY